MKTLWRILIILLACFVVIGVTYAIGQPNAANQPASVEQRPADDANSLQSSEANRADDAAAQIPAGEPRPGGLGLYDVDLSVAGWLGFTKPLVPMTLIIALVSFLTNWNKRRRLPTMPQGQTA